MITAEKVEWVTGKFKPFNAAGDDRIFPALLKEGGEILLELPCGILRSSLVLGHIPPAWETVKVIFIPKPGKPSHFEANDYRPINLTSFVLKTLERLVDFYIRDEILPNHPLRPNQDAYQTGKSTETALHNSRSCLGVCLGVTGGMRSTHNIVTRVENMLENGMVALGCFMDIQGAFDNTAFDVIQKALIGKGVDMVIVRWTDNMLRCRNAEATICGHKSNLCVAGDCPQGGILSPILWSIVVDSLIRRLNEEGIYAQCYSDDSSVFVCGKFESTIGDMRRALEVVCSLVCRKGPESQPGRNGPHPL